MAAHNIHIGDVLDWAHNYNGEPFHALLCDPPYHLTSITKRFGGDNAAPAKHGTDGAFQRSSAGFMGKQWDGGDLAFDPATWAALAEHLYPGAWGFAFASSRGWHRMAVAIEDAGLIMQPSVFMLGWAFGSGFPKATRVKDAPAFEGHRYGGQALKPAIEPIICFQKPYTDRPVDDITATGAGALNVDAGRVSTDDTWGGNQNNAHENYSGNVYGKYASQYAKPFNPQGRWPANLALTHTPDCTYTANGWQCVEGCPVRAIGEQSGESVSKQSHRDPNGSLGYYGGATGTPQGTIDGINDTGTAARFFFNADYLLERLEDTAPFLYAAKADRWQREAGLFNAEYQTAGDGRQKSIDNAYQRGETKRRNIHPTVKSLELTRWLASLLLPPDAYAPRRLLVPFSGSGSEMVGALLAGWDGVQGIEQSTEYADIAWQRLEFWQDYAGMGYEQAREYAEVKAEAEAKQANMNAPLDDLPLFRTI